MPLNVNSGQVISPPRILIYGPPGIGKTTFAAGAGKKSIFIPCEEGADVVGADRFNLCEDVGAVMSALDDLIKEDHDYKVVALDSLIGLNGLFGIRPVPMLVFPASNKSAVATAKATARH